MDTAGSEVGAMTRTVIEACATREVARRSPRPAAWICGLLLLVAICPGSAVAAGLYEQTFVLQPGWNAVYLEVEPETEDVESVFAGVPVASVWTWMPQGQTVEYIQDPAEGMDNQGSGWLGYFPRPRPEAFLTNMFFVLGNRAYLVKLDGTQPVTWTVSGKPSLLPTSWAPDSFNLVGLHVDPDRPPTFGAYFAGSEAHEGQPIFTLDPSGVWTAVEHPYSATARSGEAYWVYCEEISDFDGPLEVSTEWDDTLSFAASLDSRTLIVRNMMAVDVDVTVRQLVSPNPVPLSLQVEDEETSQATWAVLPTVYSRPAIPGQQLLLDFGIRRAELTADTTSHVLAITNGLGARRLVAVEGNRVFPTAPAKSAGRGGRSFKAVGTPFAGLWQGTALVSAVSEAQLGGSMPFETGKAFPLRVLLHVDGAGTVHLVKEVIEMWEEGTMVPDPEDPDFMITETPGRAVLLTNEDLIPDFTGVVVRDGVPVGIRISTVAYDFPEETLEMNGVFGLTGQLEVTIAMDAEHPTNPFLHSFHPDHNNLDEQYLNFHQEAYEVTRRVQFIFSETDPSGENPPGWGESEMGGAYFEEVNGLHRNTIFAGGTFQLRRVAAVPELNR